MINKIHRIIELGILFMLLYSCNHFDDKIPDTAANKKHFENFLKVKITPDVKNIYTCGDEIGIDASYHIAFECHDSTKNKIININNFTPDNISGIGIQPPPHEWWDEQEILHLPQFSNIKRQYHRYFWYDSISQKAYYSDFDL